MKKIAWFLVLAGAVNWGFMGIGFLVFRNEINLVKTILGYGPLSYVMYSLIGLSALYVILGNCGCSKCLRLSCKSRENGTCDSHKRSNG